MSATCPACGAEGPTEYGLKGTLRLVACNECGLVYSDPQPRARVREKYLDEYDLATHFGAWSRRKRVLYQRRFRELPVPSPGRDRLCDVGCGDGQFLELASRLGWRADGIELNPPAAARASERGEHVYEGALEEIEGLPWGSYDLVTSWDVLEHTPDPRPFTERLARLASPAGTVVLTTLNRRALVSRAFGMRWSMIAEDHFTYWHRSSLERLLVTSGLVPSHLTSFGLGRDFFRWADGLQRRLLPRPKAVAGAPPERAGELARGGWDTWPPVLLAEQGANRLLGAVGGGLELYAVAQRESRH